MNSRQRRKTEAHKHNMLIVENHAYSEDKLRDPEKYKARKRVHIDNSNGNFGVKKMHVITALAMAASL